MIVFEIKGTKKTFKVPEEWSEVTLAKYSLFVDLIQVLHDKLKKDKKEDIGFYQIVLEYRNEFNDIFNCFTGVDKKIINKIKANDIYTTYTYIMSFLEEPKYKKLESFTFKKKKYYLPKSKIDYFGNEIEMGNASFGEVVEAMQIQELDKTFSNNNFKALPYQIAILCRPKGEKYDDQKVKERAEIFKDLSMDIVWNIAFFLIKHKQEYLKHFQQSLEEMKKIKVLQE